jgi:hypothetical protein
MDSQFNTLLSSYRDNYIEYKLTGNRSNQSAYMSAKQGIDNIISSLEGEVSTNKEQISAGYSDESKADMSKMRDQMRNSKLDFSSSKDQLEGAKMRSQGMTTTAVNPDLKNYYIAAGVLSGIAILLSIF